MQSTDPGGVYPNTQPTNGTHSTSTTSPNVTSPVPNPALGSNNEHGVHIPLRGKGTWGRFMTWTDQWRGSRQLVLVIVAIALLLDNMLLTVVGK